MTFQLQPLKHFILRDNSRGTEYESLLESIKYWEAKLREIEEQIEILKQQLATAEGHP